MVEVHLPKTLLPLFAGLEPVVTANGATVGDALSALDGRWPGLMDRLCEPGPRYDAISGSSSDRLKRSSPRRWARANESTLSPPSPAAEPMVM